MGQDIGKRKRINLWKTREEREYGKKERAKRSKNLKVK